MKTYEAIEKLTQELPENYTVGACRAIMWRTADGHGVSICDKNGEILIYHVCRPLSKLSIAVADALEAVKKFEEGESK